MTPRGGHVSTFSFGGSWSGNLVLLSSAGAQRLRECASYSHPWALLFLPRRLFTRWSPHLLGRSRGSARAFPLLLALGGSDRQAVNGIPSLMRYDRSELGHIDAGLPRISLWCWEIVLSWQYIFVDTTCSRCSYTSHGVTWTFVRRGRNSHGIPSLMRYGRSELGHV